MTNFSAASLLGFSAVLMGISNLCLKSSIGHVSPSGGVIALIAGVARQPVFLCGFVLFGLSSLLYMRVLTTIALSTAYPILVSIAFAIVAVGAVMLFGERLTATKLLGTAMLIGGISFISRG